MSAVVPVLRVFRREEIREAHALMAPGEALGKLVLLP